MGVDIMQFLILLLALPIFLLPTIIAVKRDHRHKTPIILINVILGFFGGIGWIVALIWAIAVEPKEPQPQTVIHNQTHSSSQELERLHKLKTDGILSDEEFAREKDKLLNQDR